MRSWRRIVTLAVVAFGCGGCAAASASHAPLRVRPAQTLVCRGARVPKLPADALGGPGVEALGCELLGVAAASPTDVWAVGARAAGPRAFHSLVEHWDGRRWRVVATPDVGELVGVATLGSDDVWAASNGRDADAFGAGVFLHWNGAVWRRVAAAAGPRVSLSGLAAVGRSDVWAVGTTSAGHGVIERWNGRSWHVARVRAFARLTYDRRQVELTGVVARSPADVWVAGTISPDPRSGRRDFTRALVLHWDGHSWWRVPGPQPGRYLDTVASIGIDGGGRIWLGGTFETDRPNGHIVAFGSLLAVREGGRWVTSTLPGSYRHADTPVSIAGSRPGDLWAVGSGEWASGRFIGHWSGHRWRLVPLPRTHGSMTPYGLASLSPSDAWIVGDDVRRPARLLPVALHWNGHAWASSPVVR